MEWCVAPKIAGSLQPGSGSYVYARAAVIQRERSHGGGEGSVKVVCALATPTYTYVCMCLELSRGWRRVWCTSRIPIHYLAAISVASWRGSPSLRPAPSRESLAYLNATQHIWGFRLPLAEKLLSLATGGSHAAIHGQTIPYLAVASRFRKFCQRLTRRFIRLSRGQWVHPTRAALGISASSFYAIF